MQDEEFQSSEAYSLINDIDFLLDIDKTLFTKRQVELEKWSNIINLIESQSVEIDQHDSHLSDLQKRQKCRHNKLKSDIQELREADYLKKTKEKNIEKEINVLKTNIKNNETNVIDDNELSDLIEKMSKLKAEREEEKENLSNDFKAFKQGVFYYKKYLLCNTFYSSKEVIFTFDTSAKKIADATNFIRFTTKDKGVTFNYIEMKPKLKEEHNLVEAFNKRGDIQAFLLAYFKILKSLTYN